MVDGINSAQQVLMGTIVAEDVQQTTRDKRLTDKQAFNTELQKAETLKQSQVGDSKGAETENKIREEDENKEGGHQKQNGSEKKPEEVEKLEEDVVNNIPQSPNPKLLDEEKHEIDLKA